MIILKVNVLGYFKPTKPFIMNGIINIDHRNFVLSQFVPFQVAKIFGIIFTFIAWVILVICAALSSVTSSSILKVEVPIAASFVGVFWDGSFKLLVT